MSEPMRVAYADPYTRIAWWQEKASEERIARVAAEEALRQLREAISEAVDDLSHRVPNDGTVTNVIEELRAALAAVPEENQHGT